MKKIFIKLVFIFTVLIISSIKVHAIQFDLLVLPVNITSVCDNYYCFPEVSNIIADDIISNFESYKRINVQSLASVRQKLNNNTVLMQKTKYVLDEFANKDKIDFPKLNEIAAEFGVKSILLINSYAINDKTELRRSLWDILEISSAFKITYPFELKTSAILTDCVNSLIMWSGKYSKSVSDSFGYYNASTQTQALSQLEKIKQYSYYTVSKNISQNVYMRFFPKDVRTFTVNKKQEDNQPTKFVPNALEHLSDPHLLKDFESETDKKFRNFDLDEFIF